MVAIQIFQRIWAYEMPELKIRHIVSRKTTEPIRRVFYTRKSKSRCVGILQIDSVKLKLLLTRLSLNH